MSALSSSLKLLSAENVPSSGAHFREKNHQWNFSNSAVSLYPKASLGRLYAKTSQTTSLFLRLMKLCANKLANQLTLSGTVSFQLTLSERESEIQSKSSSCATKYLSAAAAAAAWQALMRDTFEPANKNEARPKSMDITCQLDNIWPDRACRELKPELRQRRRNS